MEEIRKVATNLSIQEKRRRKRRGMTEMRKQRGDDKESENEITRGRE